MQLFFRPFAGVIGMLAYAFLINSIIKLKVKQSFFSFLLWAMLDTIATVTTIFKGGNYWLPLSNALGGIIVSILLAIKKQVSFSWVEASTAVLVIVCLILWYFSGPTAGIISSSLAVVIAGIPQIVETYERPSETPTGVYIIFLTANMLSFVAGKNWTIQERFYSGCTVLLCLVIVLFSVRNFRKNLA